MRRLHVALFVWRAAMFVLLVALFAWLVLFAAKVATAAPPVVLNLDGQSMSLTPSTLIAPGARVIVVGADGRTVTRPLTAKTYQRTGDAKNWARITVRDDGTLAGVVMSGGRVTELDAERGATRASAAADAAPGICLPPRPPPQRRVTAPARRRMPAGSQLVAQLGIVVDHAFVMYAGSTANAMARIVAVFNAVDGIFQSQHGVALQLARVVVFETLASDPLSTTRDIGAALDDVAAYWDAHRTDTLSGVDAVQLISGREFDGSTIGLAWFDTVCQPHVGSSVAQYTWAPGTYTRALLSAHELGHTFHAPHDAQVGSECSYTEWGKWVMNPSLGATLLDQFSACTRAQVAGALPGYTCLDTQLAPPPAPPLATPTPVSLVQNAAWVLQEVPSVMAPGALVPVRITMKNTGTAPWTAADAYRLGSINPYDNANWGTSRAVIAPSVVVPSGETVTFSFIVRAPPIAGTYHFQWRMLQEAVAWFGAASPDTTIHVAQPTPTAHPATPTSPVASPSASAVQTSTRALPTLPPPAPAGYNAAPMRVTVPTRVARGQSVRATVRMRNTGTAWWSAYQNVKLQVLPLGSTTWGVVSVPVLITAPGALVDIPMTVRAPLVPGLYVFQWQMAAAGARFGQPTAPLTIEVY